MTVSFDGETLRKPIDRIVIHSTVGTVQSAISMFSRSEANTSAHYIIGNDGKLYAGLEEFNVAYHAGNYAMNQRSIGIEHEWYSGIHPTDALYKESAALVRDICQFYNLPIDATTIIPHKSVIATSCPNEIDVNRIIAEAKGVQQVDDCPARLAEKTALETTLRGVITKKDELLKMQEVQIGKLSEDLKQCQTTIQSSLELQNKLDKLQKRYTKLLQTPSKFQTDMLLSICEKLGIQI